MNNKELERVNSKININEFDTEDLWTLYGMIIRRLKETGAIRTKNMTAERGEQLAINIYNNTRGLPNLQAAPPGTKNVDALSRNGERYSIKTIKTPGRLTGVFWGMGTLDNPVAEKKFEFLIIVVIDEYYQLEKIYELSWDIFFKFKRWHSTMKAFNISLTKNLSKQTKITYKK